VYLNGEAFFSIAKNPERPFIIHLHKGTIKVLGTSFNVRAYDNEKIVETSVSSGRVAFIPNYENPGKKNDTVLLLPDKKLRYFLNREELTVAATSSRDDKAWTEGKLVFKSRSLEDISIELERNFGKKIVFLDDEPKNYVLTGSFQNNSLDEIMFYLSKTKSFSYKITNSELVIASTNEGTEAY
jgi:ferric-dicitrate binding protein FerR (iron transport regulator)